MEVKWFDAKGPEYAQGYPLALAVRNEVFVREQGFEKEEDDIDPLAWHVIFLEETVPIATARIYTQGDGWHIGRVAVLKKRRGKGLGAILMEQAEKKAQELGAEKVRLSAQVRQQGFYERCGYTPFGEIYYDEYCPHIGMEKELRL